MIKDKLQRLFEAGITKCVEAEHSYLNFSLNKTTYNLEPFEYDDKPKVLKMKDLKAGFTIWTHLFGFIKKTVKIEMLKKMEIKRKERKIIKKKNKKI